MPLNPSVAVMNNSYPPSSDSGAQATTPPTTGQRLHWPLILLLGAIALIRPLLHLTGVIGGILPSGAVTVLVVTALITAVWIAAVLRAGIDRPLVTLVLAALVYAGMSMIMSAILSPILVGALPGPVANPIAIPSMLLTNAVWGAIAGGIAAGLRRVVVRR